MNRTVLVSITALLTTGGVALAQCPGNTLYNDGFEIEEPVFGGAPEGWGTFPTSGGGVALWVDAGDPGAQVRTGSKSIMLGNPDAISGSFIGFTTNVFDQFGVLYDPPYAYQAGLDLHVSGYFNIPDGEELAPGGVGAPLGELNGIKLELRRVPPDFSIYEYYEFNLPVSTTHGQWEYFEITITDAMVPDFPPYPESVTILPCRWDPLNVAMGTIYWDDLCVYQSSGSLACSIADVTTTGAGSGDPGYGVPDGAITGADIQYYVNLYVAADLAADVTTTGAGSGDPGYGVPDGSVTAADIQYYVNFWVAGCP